ncbi:MAG: glutathione S-transferase family protein [Pseudomonadota bacterium]
MKLYDMNLAPNPRRVRMFLAEKGIEIETVEIDIPSGKNLAPEYLAINPRGIVPSLVLDDGTVIDETVAICRYFEELHPEPNLLGRDAKEKAIIEGRQRHMEMDGFIWVGQVFRNESPLYVDRALPGVNGAFRQLPELAERGRMLFSRYIEKLDQDLATHEFVAGDRFTIADITAFIAVGFARWVKMPVPEDCENVLRWRKAVSERPSAKA